MSIVIDKEKLVQAIRDVIPKVTVTRRVVQTDSNGSYSEKLAGQLGCISLDPNVICVQYTDGQNYYVRTYYTSTDVDNNMIVGDTIVHTHALKVAPNVTVVIIEAVIQSG